MGEDPSLLVILRPLVALVALASVLGVFVMVRRGFRGDRPMVAVLAALGLAALATFLLGARYPALPVAVVLAGLGLAVVPASLHQAALVTRIRGAHRVSSWLALAVATLQPTARNRSLAAIARVLARVRARALAPREGLAALRALPVLPLLTVQLALLEGFAVCRRAESARLLSDTLEPGALSEFGKPHLAGYAAWLVASLCESGRLDDAAAVVGELERTALEDPGRRGHPPEECDAFHNRARLTLAAWAGERAAVQAALSASSPLRVLVTRGEARSLRARASEPPSAPLREDTLAVVRAAVAALATEARLANGFSHLRAPAPATLGFMALTVVAYALSAQGGSTFDPERLLWLGACHRDLVLQGESWRLLTSAGLHLGPVHLAINVLVGLEFGDITERFLGASRLALVLLAAALAGSLGHVYLGRPVVMVGASGAIFGVFGAALAVVTTYRSRVPARWYARQRVRLVSAIVLNLYLGATLEVVSLSAHVGGFLAGLLLAGLLARADSNSKTLARALSVVAVAAWLAAGAWAAHGWLRARARPLEAWVPLRHATVTVDDGLDRATVRVAHPITWQVEPRPAPEGARVGPWIVGPEAQFVGLEARCEPAPPGRRVDRGRSPGGGFYLDVGVGGPRGTLTLRYWFGRAAQPNAALLAARLADASSLVGCARRGP